MPTVLIVDDSAKDRGLAGGLLAKDDQNSVTFATNGREALEQVHTQRPDLVVSDLQMPEMNGLELVEAMREHYPSVPIILMTARGSEEIAAEALRKGASGYVPKSSLAQNLLSTVRRVMSDAEADRMHSRLMHSMLQDECVFRLRNDPEQFDALVGHLQELLRCLPLGDEAERLRVSIAVRHALWIAHAHGNLEIPVVPVGDEDELMDDAAFLNQLNQRSSELPYVDRALTVHISVTRDEAIFTLSHEGAGLNVVLLPEDLHEEAADRSWLSRFVVLPAVMDDVSIEDNGRTLRLLKTAVSGPEALELG